MLRGGRSVSRPGQSCFTRTESPYSNTVRGRQVSGVGRLRLGLPSTPTSTANPIESDRIHLATCVRRCRPPALSPEDYAGPSTGPSGHLPSEGESPGLKAAIKQLLEAVTEDALGRQDPDPARHFVRTQGGVLQPKLSDGCGQLLNYHSQLGEPGGRVRQGT
ncbi:uncharacterized protein LOC143151607 [Ptiloglossa arizonensis]|uniref:uncharacterized protein LOC143151607 n=1 Tax=Ptiloglossa arizonensis TaxID=3350558 RepID=UPI003F9F6EA9